MNAKTPKYLLIKNNITLLVLFTAVFALLFINIFQPFGSRGWYKNISDFTYFFFSSLIILTGMLVVVVSRVAMWFFSKKRDVLLWHFFAHIVAEILAMSLFFSLFAKFVLTGGAERDFMHTFKRAITNTSLVLLLPYTISWLYLAWQEKKNQLETLGKQAFATLEAQKKTNILNFFDEKGEIKLTLAAENLLYIESADNYAIIHYLNKLKISHFTLRNSLKKIEQLAATSSSLVRCHRSFIVNLDNVKVMRKTKEGILLELDALGTPDIPVSATFYRQVIEKFSQYSV